MKLITLFKKKQFCDDQRMFDNTGNIVMNKDSANLLDTILLIIAVENQSGLMNLSLELRKCGFFITIPQLKNAIKKLTDDGYVGVKQKEYIFSN